MKSSCQPITYILCIICLLSCNKKTNSLRQTGFVRSISANFEACVKSSVELEDGNYVVVCEDYLHTQPGLMVKLDSKGGVLWKKNLSANNLIVWKIISLSHKGFVTIGLSLSNSNAITACIYDLDGNLLAEKDISSSPYTIIYSTVEAIPLNNGNFAIAYSVTPVTSGKCTLLITDSAFNKLHTRIIFLPDTSHVVSTIKGLCEHPDGSIALTAFTHRKVPSGVSYMVERQCLWMVRTSLTGVIQTNKILSDTTYSETPFGLAPHLDGLLSVSGRMLGFNNKNGAWVNYYGAGENFISGRITLNRCNASGDIIDRTEITDYPRNGLINSIRKTTDGGYILCGTVDQLSDVNLVSDTKVYLLKLNQNLSVAWSRIIQTTYPAVGTDIFETTKGDFLVSGYQRVFNKRFEMLVMKTDAFGNIY